MKKVILVILVFTLTVTFTSCSNWCTNMGIWGDNDEQHADKTFNEIISAIRLKDASKIVDIFSNEIKHKDDLLQSALTFIDYVRGDVISFSSAYLSSPDFKKLIFFLKEYS